MIMKCYTTCKDFLLLLFIRGTTAHNAVPRISIIPKAKNMGLYDPTVSNTTPHIGGPINWRTPLTNKDIPYDELSFSVPSISAKITVVIPMYMPEDNPNNAQKKESIV